MRNGSLPLILAFPLLLAALPGCTMVSGAGDEFRSQGSQPRVVTPDEVARRHIETRDIRAHIRFLASDARRGRATPSEGLERSAAWLADAFHDAGLSPAGQDGGFLQYWPYDRVGLVSGETRLEWGDGALEYGRDFAALPSEGGGEGSLVYLGWAQDAPDSMHLANGKVAVVLLPGESQEAWRWPINVRRALITATRAGALGVVFVLDPAFDEAAIQRLATQFQIPATEPQGVPLFFVRESAAAALLDAAGSDLARLTAATRAGDRTPVLLDAAPVRAAAPAERISVQVPNVIGLLPAGDTTRGEEYIILVAHYDHLGVGDPNEAGDSIYNGADDNASGVAALVEVAKAFAALPVRPARPILFLATGGEEHGLLGATWFVSNPTVFLTRAVAVLNMDMIGRNHPDSIGVTGYAYSTLGPLIDQVASTTPELGLAVTPDPHPRENLFQRSDHFAFARRGTPAVNFFSGLHEDYHTPEDEVAKIDADKVARVARLIFLTAHRLASGEVTPEWTEPGRAAIRPQGPPVP